MHRVWSMQMEPYLTSDDPSEAVMQSCFAIFQLGVAIALDKFDEPPKKDEAPDDADVEEALDGDSIADGAK